MRKVARKFYDIEREMDEYLCKHVMSEDLYIEVVKKFEDDTLYDALWQILRFTKQNDQL